MRNERSGRQRLIAQIVEHLAAHMMSQRLEGTVELVGN
jgi:hypothetical protein